MILKIVVGLQIALISLMADGEGITKVGTQLDNAGNLMKKGGSGFNLVEYTIIFLGILIMGMGVNDTFIAQDKGGENKKMHGVLKMIGGAMFLAIGAIYSMFYSPST